MLPAKSRVRRRAEHQLVTAAGRRVRRGPLVVHLYETGMGPARAGFVVGRRVGPAVDRNTVKRRLRELVRVRLPDLPAGALLVVRALPAAGGADFHVLAASLDDCLRALDSRQASAVQS